MSLIKKILITGFILSLSACSTLDTNFTSQSKNISEMQFFLHSKALLNNYQSGVLDKASIDAIERYQWLLKLPEKEKINDISKLILEFKKLEQKFKISISRYENFTLDKSRQFINNTHFGINFICDFTNFREPKLHYQLQFKNSSEWMEIKKEKTSSVLSNCQLSWSKNQPVTALKVIVFDGPVLIKQQLFSLNNT